MLMENLLFLPGEGENVRWGEERNYAGPELHGVDTQREVDAPSVPRPFPHIPDSFQSEEEADKADNSFRSSLGRLPFHLFESDSERYVV